MWDFYSSPLFQCYFKFETSFTLFLSSPRRISRSFFQAQDLCQAHYFKFETLFKLSLSSPRHISRLFISSPRPFSSPLFQVIFKFETLFKLSLSNPRRISRSFFQTQDLFQASSFKPQDIFEDHSFKPKTYFKPIFPSPFMLILCFHFKLHTCTKNERCQFKTHIKIGAFLSFTLSFFFPLAMCLG